MLFGVPMNWMTRWPGDYPVFVDRAEGARFWDVDGNVFVDFCLGDTGGMAGHAPKVTVDAIAEQAAKGITLMLPTEDAAWVGREMARRFGLPFWNFTLTATDANRFAIRWARQVTGRSKVVVHNWCYHGSVDESFATLDARRWWPARAMSGSRCRWPRPRGSSRSTTSTGSSARSQRRRRRLHVRAGADEHRHRASRSRLPRRGARSSARQYGTLLLIDETHTISAGPGGCTKAWGLQPDIVTIGKTLGAGIPSAAYGMSQALSDRVYAQTDWKNADVGGVGGTLAGNALSLAAMRATLGEVMTDEAFERMIALGERFEDGVRSVIESRGLPWHVVRLGCRVEYLFRADKARNGSEAAAGQDEELDSFIHLYLLNRGILMTPFHNMALMSPATSPEDVDRHTEVFGQAADELIGA